MYGLRQVEKNQVMCKIPRIIKDFSLIVNFSAELFKQLHQICAKPVATGMRVMRGWSPCAKLMCSMPRAPALSAQALLQGVRAADT